VCVCVEGGTESPTVGVEQAAANHIVHAANDDWRREDKGRAGSHLKAQVGSFLR